MTTPNLKNKNTWALITGASGGIGLAYAEQIAEKGKPIILVARNEEKLNQVAEKIGNKYQVPTKVIAADLTKSEDINNLFQQTDELNVDILINNAGKEEAGEFLSLTSDEMLSSIALNCSAPLLLTHHFANKMAANSGGDILYLASIVGFQGVPLIANYAATKAYLLTFAEGIAHELKANKVNISIAAPGFTDTNLAPAQSFDGLPMKPMSADFVANYTLERLGKQQLIIPGFINKFLYYSGKFLQSRNVNSVAFGKVFKKIIQH